MMKLNSVLLLDTQAGISLEIHGDHDGIEIQVSSYGGATHGVGVGDVVISIR